MKLDVIDKQIGQYIFDKPQVVEKMLLANGYTLSNKVTLNELTEKTYIALYQDKNVKFAEDFDKAIRDPEYSGFVTLAVGAALSIASSLFGAAQAKKQRALQAKIAVAQLEQDKLLAEEKLRVYGEVERTRILANSLQQYRSNLQTESTKRQKNVYAYLIAIGLSIAIIYSTTILIKANKSS